MLTFNWLFLFSSIDSVFKDLDERFVSMKDLLFQLCSFRFLEVHSSRFQRFQGENSDPFGNRNTANVENFIGQHQR